MNMALTRHVRIAALMAIAMTALCNCQKPDDTQGSTEPEVKTNYFNYEGYLFDINSVVRYDQGDSSVELWLSPMVGATNIAEIEKEGDYVVINTNKAYLGKRDRFSEGTSKYSYIRFGADHKFAYGNSGAAYIEASIKDEVLTLSFLAQNLYTKAEAKAAIQGSYKGSFTTETEQPYNNEWGFDRNRETLASASITTYETGENPHINLYSSSSNESIKITLVESLLGKTITLPYTGSSSNIKITYNGTENLNLSNATGTIKTGISDGKLQVNMDIIMSGKRFRAVYNGACTEKTVKLNRFIYKYGGTSAFPNGIYEIVKLLVDNNGTRCKFFFSPSDNYTIQTSSFYQMPVLTVPSSIINAGRKTFLELENWELMFDVMQVFPYEDEYKPHPANTDWIEVKKDGNNYEVEFVLSGIATNMTESSLDVYYKGIASK